MDGWLHATVYGVITYPYCNGNGDLAYRRKWIGPIHTYIPSPIMSQYWPTPYSSTCLLSILIHYRVAFRTRVLSIAPPGLSHWQNTFSSAIPWCWWQFYIFVSDNGWTPHIELSATVYGVITYPYCNWNGDLAYRRKWMEPIHTKMSHQVSKAIVCNMLINTIWSRVAIHRILKTSFSFIPCPVSTPASDWLTTMGSDTHYKLISVRYISQWRLRRWVVCCNAPIWPSGIIMFRCLWNTY